VLLLVRQSDLFTIVPTHMHTAYIQQCLSYVRHVRIDLIAGQFDKNEHARIRIQTYIHTYIILANT